ncbi:FkbM family methyltransferase [Nafulsella turpanensis]|uniref:FkbM family methyltransferase n=1 Tax=Nafulsella turpanensis TaxID=1265690 RepID=UPI0003694B5D|nr:FkbM family methyltransferase [Nafulsella turpanensis]
MPSLKYTVKNKARAFYKDLTFNLSASNSPLFMAYYQQFYKPKQGTIAEFADYFSRRNRNLTVIQVGANDGFNHDPIHKFIKRDKWKGVLLEPQSDVYHQYLERLYRKSEGIHTINAALDYKDGESTIYKVAFSNARWATGLTSFDRSVLEKAVQSEHVASCARKEGVEIPERVEDRIKAEKIKAISPQSLLQQYHIQHIDWLQIDTEGFDFEIIKMFDIGTTKPTVIVFEHFLLSEEDRQSCFDLLHRKEYEIKVFGRDVLAIKSPTGEYGKFL